jgi:hypothetical protein
MTNIAVLVCAELEMPRNESPERLEDVVIRVMELLEDDSNVIGPAVGCDFEQPTIDVRFSVEADSSAEIHAQISKITRRLDDVVGGRVRTSMAPSEQVELSCA